VSRLLGVACLALVAISAGCGGGGGDSLVSETGVRECLAQAGMRPEPTGSQRGGAKGYAPIYAADFTAAARDGPSVDVVVQRASKRAAQTAADIRSALQSFGPSAGDTADRVLSARNAVAVFSRTPSAGDRAAVRGCLNP
jgi:hypothetical protein